MKKHVFKIVLLFVGFFIQSAQAQVPVNINSGNPNFPFPQFKDYNSGKLKTLSHYNHQPAGMTHAEMELRIREAYKILSNNMTYNIDQNGTLAPLTVNGVKYIMPFKTAGNDHCTCVEGDGYYLLAAAYMGDKATFDGYFMWAHDRQFQNTTRFVDNLVNSPNYAYSSRISGAGDKGTSLNVYGGGLDKNSAGDGDVDLAMALLVAWKQWGDNGVICNDPQLGTITYKEEALKYFRAMVDVVPYVGSSNPVQMNSGIIGFDGYMKGGDTWNELTNWATPGNPGYDASRHPQRSGNEKQHIDYYAPSYFNSIAKILESEGDTPWRINQFKRAEASSDWLMGQMAVQNLISYAGWVEYNDTGSPVYSKYNEGEDFRAGWRTVLNYVWNGNPTTSWNPETHQVENTPNTYEYNIGINTAKFLKDPQSFGVKQYSTNSLPMNICGTNTMRAGHLPNGLEDGEFFRLNWPYGTLSPSAITAQDFATMAKMYRKCEISWTANGDGGQKYLDSNPVYFHEWFRLLGMMLMSGNYHDPLDFTVAPNLKVYKKVDKTFAYEGDTITYTLNFRNYGKGSATNVSIKDTLPTGLSFLSQKTGKYTGTFGNANGILSWNYANIPGTDGKLPNNLNDTRDSVVLKVLVTKTAIGRLCNTSSIFENGTFHWKTNEYPNNVSEVMERNCVDILTDKPLTINKSVSRKIVQVGDSVSYTIIIKNKSVGFLNGGRPGVHFSFAVDGLKTSANNQKQSAKIFHGAEEAYINLKNYRYSYFMKEPIVPNWIIVPEYGQGVGSSGASVQTQALTPGDGYNHRIIVRFPNIISTVFQHLVEYGGPSSGTSEIHRGETAFPWLQSRFETNPNGNFNFSDDWSADPTFVGDINVQNPFTLITNDWTDIKNPNIPVTKLHPDACDNYTKKSNKILVEEFDGYTWRRIFGTSPVDGRELLNVKVIDSLPNGVVFGGFVAGHPTGTIVGNTVTWPTISQMLVNDSIIYKFWVTVKDASFFGCPGTPNPSVIINKAKVSADNEGTVSDTAITAISCNEVFVSLKNFTKVADKANYQIDDEISYTIGWKNKSGSIVKGIGTSSNWTQVAGNPFIFNAPTMLINGIGANGATGNNVMVHKYAHGNNGSIKATLSLASDQEQYALIFRQNGDKWYEIRFKKFYNGIEVSAWDYGYTTNGTYTELLPNQLNPSTSTFVDVKVDLLDKKLSFSVVNSGNVMPSAGQYTFLNLQDVVGSAGWRSNNNSSSTVSAWYTNLDSSFDVQLVDPIPSDVTFVSASNANLSNCSSCGSSSIVGTNVADVVTYPIIKGPIAFNDSITFVWKAKLATCPTNGKIINIASMKIYGVSPDITAQNISTCGTIPICTFTTATLTPSGSTTFCKGKNVTFTAATNGTTNVRYQLYKGNVALGTPQTSTTFVIDSAGSYKLRAFDNLNTTCFAESQAVVVAVNPLPVAILTPSATSYCNASSGITLTATDAGAGTTYEFQNGTTAGTASTTPTLANALAGSWTVIVKSSQGCADTSVATIITANPKPTAAFTRNPTGPVTIGTLVNFTNTSTGASTNHWKIDGLAFASTTNSTYTFDKSGSFKIRLIATSSAGCKDSIETTIDVDLAPTCKAPTNLLPINALVTRCVGDTANLKASYVLNATPLNGYRFVWYKKGEIIPVYSANTSYVPKAFTNLAIADAGDWILRIEDGSAGSATCLAETTVKLVVNPIPVADILPKTAQYCGTTGASISATPNGNGETYEWFKDNLPFGTVSTSNVLSNALAGSYTVQVVSNGCKSVVSSASVVSQTNAIVPKVEISADKPTSCAGEMITFTANPTNATSYEWFVNSQKQTSIIATFSSTSLSNNDTVKVILTTNEACANPKVAQDTILAKVQPVLVPTLTLKSVSPKVCAGEEVTFEIESSTNAGTPTYTWMQDDVQAGVGASFSKTITAKTSVYATMKTTEACANPKEIKSEVQVVDLEENLIPSVEILANRTTVCEDDKTIEFSIMARSGTGDKPLYQWLVNGQPIAGKTNDSAFFNNLKNDDKVSLRMTSNAVCRTKDEAISNEINIILISKPESKIINTLLSYCSGSTGIALQAKDIAGATYEWFKGTTNVGTGITLPNATVGSYALKTSIGTCSATSDSVKVTQKTLPIAEINPDNLVYCQGATGATLTAKPVAGATYEWLKETVPQGSASTNNQYTSALKGLYSIKVSLDGCDSTSSEVLVTEVGSFEADVKISTNEPTICTGGTATVSIESQSDGTIEWFVDNVSKGNTSPLVFQPTANAKVLAIITTTASCASPKVAKDSVEITVTEAATADLTIKLDKIGGLQCEGDTAYLSATSNVGTVTWSNGTIGNKATFANWKNGDKIAANLRNTLACVNPKLVTKELTLNGTLRAPFDFTLNVVSNSESVICRNSELNLAAVTNVNGLTYAWKNAQEIGTDSTFKPGTATTVRGTVTASKTGCFSSGNRIYNEKEFMYILAEKIGLAFSQPPSSICENTMSFFTIVPTSGSDNIQQYVWFKNDTLQNGLTENKADFNKLKNGDVLKVKAIPKTVCSAEIPDSATFTIQVDKQPKSGFTYGKATDILYFCKGKDTVLTANETAAYQYSWLEAPTNSTNELKIKTKRTYTLVIQNGACTDTSRAVVKDYQLSMEILIEPAAEFEVGEELKLTANVGNPEQRNLSYAWSPANLFRPANAAITNMSPTETMFVTVEVKSPENCTLKDSIQLKKRDKLFIPNALTPETGDQNAVWGITGAENYPDMDIKVFNRWGTLVHEQKGYTKQWDGTLNGKPLPAGTYYYVMKHRTLDKPRVGDLTIVR